MKLLQSTHYQILEEARLKDLLAAYAHKDVLDIGCGQGKYLKILKDLSCNATGIDINSEQIEKLKEQGYTAYTLAEIPQDKKYDLILMAHIVEHLTPEELVNFLDTYLAMLKEDGKLIVVTPVLGARFYYDATHIRPYYPQSLWMMMGNLDTAHSFRSKFCMDLEDIYFFRDSYRLREVRAYYVKPHTPYEKICAKVCSITNYFLAYLHHFSKGKIGATASWIGLYGNKKERL